MMALQMRSYAPSVVSDGGVPLFFRLPFMSFGCMRSVTRLCTIACFSPMQAAAQHVRRADNSLITQCHQHEKRIGEVARARCAPRDQGCCAPIQCNEVRFRTPNELSDAAFE